jgi:low affinity Fe/Cu permease
MRISEAFHCFAKRISAWVGTPGAFLAAMITVILWTVTGPLFGYSDSWQLIINTGTTIVTFLMVFLIQNTQNRDAKAIHLKLDELIHKLKGPRNSLIDLEHCTDEELDRLQAQFETMRHRVRDKEQTHSID